MQSPWFQYPAIFILGGAVILYIDKLLARLDSKDIRSSEEKPKQDRFTREQQQKLLSRLKEYTGEGYNADIEFASVPQKPLAQSIQALFDLAGWQVRFHPTPRENEVPDYWLGVHVWGRNKHLIESIAEAFSEAGIQGIHASIANNPHPRGSQKWQRVDRQAKIRIGHNSL